MDTVQKVVMIPQMGLVEDKGLIKWANSLTSEMIGKTNTEARKLFEDALYERNMPRNQEAMVGVMARTFFKNDPLLRKPVYLFALLAPITEEAKKEEFYGDALSKILGEMIDFTLAGQIAMATRDSEFVNDILMRCMKVKKQDDYLSVAYPLQSHPVVQTISAVAVIAMLSDKSVGGQNPMNG